MAQRRVLGIPYKVEGKRRDPMLTKPRSASVVPAREAATHSFADSRQWLGVVDAIACYR